jgi:asparagine N-glycosylation enzyme membrane subunit Stt3
MALFQWRLLGFDHSFWGIIAVVILLLSQVGIFFFFIYGLKSVTLEVGDINSHSELSRKIKQLKRDLFPAIFGLIFLGMMTLWTGASFLTGKTSLLYHKVLWISLLLFFIYVFYLEMKGVSRLSKIMKGVLNFAMGISDASGNEGSGGEDGY